MDNLFSKTEWERMRSVDPKTVNREQLRDICEVHIDPHKPREERIAGYLEDIGNPYCFRCGSLVVKLSFAEDGESLEKLLGDYIASL